jgi:hypothetical protein
VVHLAADPSPEATWADLTEARVIGYQPVDDAWGTVG